MNTYYGVKSVYLWTGQDLTPSGKILPLFRVEGSVVEVQLLADVVQQESLASELVLESVLIDVRHLVEETEFKQEQLIIA